MLKNGGYAQFFWTGDWGCFSVWHLCSLAERDCLHKVQRDIAESLSCPITALSFVGSYDCPRMNSVSWETSAVLDLQRVLNAAEADAGSESSLWQLQARLKPPIKVPVNPCWFLTASWACGKESSLLFGRCMQTQGLCGALLCHNLAIQVKCNALLPDLNPIIHILACHQRLQIVSPNVVRWPLIDFLR